MKGFLKFLLIVMMITISAIFIIIMKLERRLYRVELVSIASAIINKGHFV